MSEWKLNWPPEVCVKTMEPADVTKLLTAVLERGGEFEGLGVRVKLPPPKPAAAEGEAKEPHLSRLGRQLAERKALLHDEE